MRKFYDVVIIGSGVTGLGAAFHLTKNLKKKTLLLEQFPFPHQFGSSAGHSRITRQLYEDDFNCLLMKEATLMWKELENQSKLKLFIQNGFLTFGSSEEIDKYILAINNARISAHTLTVEEAKKRFPIFNIPSNYKVLFDPIAGVLRADRCLQALLSQSLQHNLEFHEMEKVIDISVLSDDEIHVTSSKDKYKTKSLIIASGIWSKRILEKLECELPLQPAKMHYSYFNSKVKNDSIFNYENFPSFIFSNKYIYGCSGTEYPGCLKIGDFSDDVIIPDQRDADDYNCKSKLKFLENVQTFLVNFVPKADITPVNLTTCVIMKTPDGQPILDKHIKFKNVIIGCGFCGSGFKTGMINGKFLASLAVDKKFDYEMKHFSIKRFD